MAGVAVLLICIPVNLGASHFSKIIQQNQLKAKDQRILIMSQILQGIKVLKSYAWEIPFIKTISNIRDEAFE